MILMMVMRKVYSTSFVFFFVKNMNQISFSYFAIFCYVFFFSSIQVLNHICMTAFSILVRKNVIACKDRSNG